MLLFRQLKAYAGTIGGLGEFADSLDGSSVAYLTFFLEEVDHLRGVKHQAHSLGGLDHVALDGLSGRLEGDFAVLCVIDIGSAEGDAIHLGRELVTGKERERGVVAIDTNAVVVACQRGVHVRDRSITAGLCQRLFSSEGRTGRTVVPAAENARLVKQ